MIRGEKWRPTPRDKYAQHIAENKLRLIKLWNPNRRNNDDAVLRKVSGDEASANRRIRRLLDTQFPTAGMTYDLLTQQTPERKRAYEIIFGIEGMSPEQQKQYFDETDYDKRLQHLKRVPTEYKNHQLNLSDYVGKNFNSIRYGLLYHEMGSGKTCTATALMARLLEMTNIRNYYVLVPNTYLVTQFASDFQFICSFAPVTLERTVSDTGYIQFDHQGRQFVITTYARYLTKVQVPDPSQSCLIVDEAHNFRSASNIAVASAFASSEDVTEVGIKTSTINKILNRYTGYRLAFFLTGTPVFNSCKDLLILLNAMLKLTGQDREGTILEVDGGRLNSTSFLEDNQFLEALFRTIRTCLTTTGGIVSRVRVQDMASSLKLPKVDFSNHYYDYHDDFTGEIGTTNSYVLNSNKKYDQGIAANPIKVHMDLDSYRTIMNTRSKTENKDTHIHWDIKNCYPSRLMCNCPAKLTALFDNMTRHDLIDSSPILIHTALKHTVLALERELEARGYTNFSSPNNNTGKYMKYAIITGDVPGNNTSKIMNTYNDRTNQDGSLIKVCIITAAAGTGFTFRNTRQMHIVEPSWNISYLQQVTGRAVRHNVFDTPARAHVKVFCYLSVPPSGFDTNTIDQDMLELMRRKVQEQEYLSRALYQLSVERTFHHRNSNVPLPPQKQNNVMTPVTMQESAVKRPRVVLVKTPPREKRPQQPQQPNNATREKRPRQPQQSQPRTTNHEPRTKVRLLGKDAAIYHVTGNDVVPNRRYTAGPSTPPPRTPPRSSLRVRRSTATPRNISPQPRDVGNNNVLMGPRTPPPPPRRSLRLTPVQNTPSSKLMYTNTNRNTSPHPRDVVGNTGFEGPRTPPPRRSLRFTPLAPPLQNMSSSKLRQNANRNISPQPRGHTPDLESRLPYGLRKRIRNVGSNNGSPYGLRKRNRSVSYT